MLTPREAAGEDTGPSPYQRRITVMTDQDKSSLLERLERIEATLALLVRERTAKEWYTTEEVARIVGKAEFTVREWCRNGRIRAEKRISGRGGLPGLGHQPSGAVTIPAGRAAPGPQQLLSVARGYVLLTGRWP